MKNKKQKHGGKRKNSGRKPAEDPKERIDIFIESSIINSHGGKESAKQAAKNFLKQKQTK